MGGRRSGRRPAPHPLLRVVFEQAPRAKSQTAAGGGPGDPAAPVRSPTAREARKGWAALLKQVYEADPLCCPKCGSEMKIIAFIERRQTEVIEKILRHCGLWKESPARGPSWPGVTVES